MKKLYPVCVVLCLICIDLAWVSQGDAAEKKAARLDYRQKRELKAIWSRFTKVEQSSARSELFEKMLALAPAAAGEIKPLIEAELRKGESAYIKALEGRVRDLYVETLLTLNQEQVNAIQGMRRLWQSYVLQTRKCHDFQKTFLQPCMDAKKLLLIDVEDITDEAIGSQRGYLMELAGYLDWCHDKLGIDIDPTQGKVSKTGHAYPSLNQPPTYRDNLSYLERTVVLAHTLAPPGARKVLMDCAEAAREIDVQEAEFVMFSNEVRMLVGQIAWVVDPLMCACTRDHSADRAAGKASMHTSTVKGKETLGARCRYWGCRGSSEGAGGGGPQGRGVRYIWGLSYGGGHTGPLYSLRRNVIGVGRRAGAFTSIYATDESIKHPTQATQGTLFLPPGFDRSDVRGSSCRRIFTQLQREQYASAQKLLERVDMEKESPQDRMLLRFFRGWLNAQVEYFFAGLEAHRPTGDVYTLRRRIDDAKTRLEGLPGFTAERLALYEKALEGPGVQKLIKIGEKYQAAVEQAGGSNARQAMADFAKRHPGTIYAEAARGAFDHKERFKPLRYFARINPDMQNYRWPE